MRRILRFTLHATIGLAVLATIVLIAAMYTPLGNYLAEQCIEVGPLEGKYDYIIVLAGSQERFVEAAEGRHDALVGCLGPVPLA